MNWDGDFELLKKMLSASKKSGCNAVKFQSFTEEMIKNHPQKSRLMKSTISQNNVEEINKIAKTVGIEWFCTPMYSEAVKMLDPYVKRFKLRELDGRQLLKNNRTKLFEEVQKTNKEIIISSEKSPKNCQYYNTKNIKWLYCIPKYPCELNELDFRDFDIFDGFSNHTNNIMAPLTSIIKGGKILEIHITSDKKNNFIDNNVSFNYEELKMLMGLIKSAKKITIN